MFENYEKFKKDVLALTKIDLNCYKEKQMKRRIDAEAASLSMVAEPARPYAASAPESRN